MVCEMEVLDASGHVTLQWDPDDPESVKRAEAEFNRMREAGFAFFTSASVDADRLDALDTSTGSANARLEQTRRPAAEEPPLEQTRTFKPRARRTVAVKPMRGG